ncbi:single-stranded DNA-binding protein [Helicobacter apodemus]|uniref:Single-stranded DNA-binding protein n=1 Tax=Helicobacter apodemus TaxID=135569 RepID=A0A4U8UEV1_9HELI|nr:single-stranded DNA-binding protein [Helicobacter apodemus]TLE15932.1 single-stranded DNA-binding protein [Helicobacter apodemus]
MNIVTLCGYLGNHWENNVKAETKEEEWFARNTLAISKAWINKKGQRVEQTSWIPVVVFGKNAKTAVNYTTKGSGFLLSGELITEIYQVTDETTGEVKNKQSWQVVIKQFDLKASNNKKPMDTDEVQEEDKEKEIDIAYYDKNGNEIPQQTQPA